MGRDQGRRASLEGGGTSVSGAAQRPRKRTESDQWIDKIGAVGDPA